MFKLILELMLAAILGICFIVILLYSFAIMIPIAPVVVVFVIVYGIFDKIT